MLVLNKISSLFKQWFSKKFFFSFVFIFQILAGNLDIRESTTDSEEKKIRLKKEFTWEFGSNGKLNNTAQSSSQKKFQCVTNYQLQNNTTWPYSDQLPFNFLFLFVFAKQKHDYWWRNFKKKKNLHFQVYKEDFDQIKQEMKKEGGCLFSNLAYLTLKYKHYQICDRKIEITDLNIFF